MPLLAAFIGSLFSGLVAFLGRYLTQQIAVRVALYTTLLTVFGTFLGSVYVCISGLYGMLASSAGGGGGGEGNWVGYFWMGLGMFIPANAGAVLSCLASVWIATSVWRIQKMGLMSVAGTSLAVI